MLLVYLKNAPFPSHPERVETAGMCCLYMIQADRLSINSHSLQTCAAKRRLKQVPTKKTNS